MNQSKDGFGPSIVGMSRTGSGSVSRLADCLCPPRKQLNGQQQQQQQQKQSSPQIQTQKSTSSKRPTSQLAPQEQQSGQQQHSSQRSPYIKAASKPPEQKPTTTPGLMQDRLASQSESSAQRAHIASLSAMKQLDQTSSTEAQRSSGQRDARRVSNTNGAQATSYQTRPNAAKVSPHKNYMRPNVPVILQSSLAKSTSSQARVHQSNARNNSIEAVAAALSLARNPNAVLPTGAKPAVATAPAASPPPSSSSQRPLGIKMKSRPKNSERLTSSDAALGSQPPDTPIKREPSPTKSDQSTSLQDPISHQAQIHHQNNNNNQNSNNNHHQHKRAQSPLKVVLKRDATSTKSSHQGQNKTGAATASTTSSLKLSRPIDQHIDEMGSTVGSQWLAQPAASHAQSAGQRHAPPPSACEGAQTVPATTDSATISEHSGQVPQAQAPQQPIQYSVRLSNDSGSNKMANSAKWKPPVQATPFTWERYLAIQPAPAAPREAFMQPALPLTNHFKPNMLLEARDVKSNAESWSLTRVVGVDGLRLRLRFEGSDHMNDFYELIDSNNIRPVGGAQDGQPLLPPMRYKRNILTYLKFVEKVLSSSEANIAPPNLFPPHPRKPPRNLFQTNMKLEAIDRKNPDLICPATIGKVEGEQVQILFDGWKGSFDYTCPYYCRDIFPINWCRDSGSVIINPHNWEQLLQGLTDPDRSRDHFESSKKISPKITKRAYRKRSNIEASTSTTSTGLIKIKLGKRKKNKRKAKSMSDLIAPMQSTPKTQSKSNNLGETSNNHASKNETSMHTETESYHNLPNFSSVHGFKDLASDELSDVDLLPDTKQTDDNKYTCQRAVPYDEWLKLKNDNKQTIRTNTNGQRNQASPFNDMCEDTKSVDSDTVVNKSQKKDRLSSEDDASPAAKRIRQDLFNSQQQSDHSLNESKNVNGTTHIDNYTGTRVDTSRASELSSHYITTGKQRSTNASSGYESWTVEDVIQFLNSQDESLAKYSSIFVDHEIDGKAFVLLTSPIIIQHMGIKLGPSLKICTLIEQVKQLR